MQATMRRRAIWVCNAIGLFGCVAVLVANFAGIIVVDGHDPISMTISSLAAGPHAWIQDAGLDAFAVALAATAAGLLLRTPRDTGARISSAMLVLLAIDVVLIAEHNEYGDGDATGAQIHHGCVVALYVLFAVAAIAVASTLRRWNRLFMAVTLASAATWLIGGPLFLYAVPTSYDGLVERLVGLVMVGWVAALAAVPSTPPGADRPN